MTRTVTIGFGCVFAAAVVAIFLLPADVVICSPGTDVIQQFLSWRAFAAASLWSGHLPLWNPYTYSGQPFLAGFQSAVFYPPNLVFLILPLCRAVNVSFVGHLFLLALGMRRLASVNGLSPLAAALCGFVLALSGPVFAHVFAGH